MNIKLKKTKILFNSGKIFFNLGIFLLPAAFFFSSIFLFLSLIIASIKSKNILKDSWNIPLIICAFLMICVCLISDLNLTNFYSLSQDKNLNWIGLLNWIPMFWIFWCSQYYLKENKGRRSCAFFLVLGTIPILISGFGQYFFEWYGPFELLKGTIVWYQRESGNQVQILTGPFNNQNIAGTWLTTIFPLSFFFILECTKLSFNKFFYISLTLATTIATFLTHSRNAIIHISLASILSLGVSFKIIFLLLIIVFTLLASIFIFEIPLDFFNLFKENKFLSGFIPDTNKISEFSNFWRIKIWKTAILNILKNPLC